jgi:cytoskeletal protein CcmA (bactofilin family)
LFGKKNVTETKGSAPTYLGGGMKIDGKIIGKKPIWMDGELKGNIECESEVVIGPTAKIEATIKAATIKVNGQVKGDLYASARMEVLSQGKIQGNLTNLPGALIIHEGGIVEGQCVTTSKEEIKKIMPSWINAVDTKLKSFSRKEEAPENTEKKMEKQPS